MIPDSPDTGKHGDRLSLLYRISQTINSSLDLDQVLNLVMDEAIAAMHAERGFLMLGSSRENLDFRAARGLDQHTIDSPASQVSRSVVETVVSEGRPLLTSNAQTEDRLSGRESVVILGLRSVLCVPLQVKGNTIGVIYVDNRIQDGIFTPADLDLLTAIAANAAVAIDNARLYQLAVEKGRIEREIQLARQVQISLLREQLPERPGWEFAASWYPARQVAGDFYDFIPTGDDQLCLVIADVSDKGMPAALYMALTRSIVRASLRHTTNLSDGMAYANQLICADAGYGMFVTLFLACLDLKTGVLTYVNAGHNPPLVYRQSSETPERLAPTGMALGIDEKADYAQNSLRLEPGDFILMYTDGVTEAYHAIRNEEYSRERLNRMLLEKRNQPPTALAASLQASILDFLAGEPPSDDITLVIAKRME